MTYDQINTAISGHAGSPAIFTKTLTAMGNYLYGVLTEDPATAHHAARVAVAKGAMSLTTRGGSRFPQVRVALYRVVYAAIVANGATNATSDADVQTAVNGVMDNLVGAS